jgi:SAM-dependent methyltransferase
MTRQIHPKPTDGPIERRIEELQSFFGHSTIVDSYSAADAFRPGEAYLIDTFLRRGASLLDVGCGTGRTTFLLAERFARIEAFDLVPSMIEAARSRASELSHVRFFVADATDIPLPDGSHDNALFSYNGIEGIPTPELRRRALVEIHRVLAPGGRFVLTTKSCFNRHYIAEFAVKARIKAALHRAGMASEPGDELRWGDIVHREGGRRVRLHTSNPFLFKRLLRACGFRVLYFNSEVRLAGGRREPSFLAHFDRWDHFYACEKVGSPPATRSAVRQGVKDSTNGSGLK